MFLFAYICLNRNDVFNYFFFLGIFLDLNYSFILFSNLNYETKFFKKKTNTYTHANPSLTPSPLTAEQACICHALSLIVCKLRPSAISLARAEFIKSCLLANIKTGTPISFSSAKSSDNSSPVSSNLLRSALSIT